MQTSRLVHWFLGTTALWGNMQLSLRSVSQSFVCTDYLLRRHASAPGVKVHTLWKGTLGGAIHKPPRRTECLLWGSTKKKHRSRENNPHSPSAPSSCQSHRIQMSSRAFLPYVYSDKFIINSSTEVRLRLYIRKKLLLEQRIPSWTSSWPLSFQKMLSGNRKSSDSH